MNPKLILVREAAKLAAYAFVIIGLAGTARGQFGVVRAAFQAAKVVSK